MCPGTPEPIERSPYYRYERLQADLDGQVLTYLNRGALGTWQDRLAAGQLLARWANVHPGARVLHLHCGDGLVGAALAGKLDGNRVLLLDSSIAAVETSRHTLEANGITNADVELSDCAQFARDREFDSVVALLPKGRAAWEQTVLDAAAVLRPGGDLYLAGANRAGAKSAARFMERIFGHVHVLAYKAGRRVLRSVKDDTIDVPASEYYSWATVHTQVEDMTIEYVTKPGVFSWQRLDDGSRLLVQALHAHPLRPDDHVLDIGCGSGVLTLVAARQAHAGRVIAVDVDCRAVEATERTIAHNGITHAEALLSDCGWAVRDQSFSAVVTNPPFHSEQATTYAIAKQIIRDAARLLRKRGNLYLVANAFLKYGPVIADAFGNATVLAQTGRYKVWHAVRHW